MFKNDFKYYKRRSPPPNYDSVINFNLLANNITTIKEGIVQREAHVRGDSSYSKYGLKEMSTWKIFDFKDKSGLFFIVNPFTKDGQQYWVQRCLKYYTKKPNRLNLDPFNELQPGEDWWELAQIDNERGKRLLHKMRWATLGYHHNWDTKEYSEAAHDEFPPELAGLSRLIVEALNDPSSPTYQAEAAIINFYHLDSTLSGHQDVSEPNMNSPLVSISFGQSAIFLVGGNSLEESATAMFIHSGDVVVMSGPARHCYHGVPRIIPTSHKPWVGNSWESTPCGRFLDIARINMNVRQVLLPNKQEIKK